MNSLITITNLSISFGEKEIIKNFNYKFDENKVYCLIGKSGGGKSSLFKSILGLIDFAGDIEIKGSLSYMPQDLALFEEKTVIQNIMLPFKLTNTKVDNQKIIDVLNEFNLFKKKDTKIRYLSGGEKSRCALARAIILNYNILLLDEPLSKLDMLLKYDIVDFILKIQKKYNLMILYITHDLHETLTISDEILILKDNNITSYKTNTMNVDSLKLLL